MKDESLNQAILAASIPMALEMFLESLFAITDVFWVGRLGPDAVSIVGCCECLMTLVLALSAGLSIGVTALVARRLGEGDQVATATAASQAMLLSAVVSACVAWVGCRHAPALLAYTGAPAGVIAEGTRYARLTLGGCSAVVLLFVNNAIFRGCGRASTAMKVLLIANGINLLLAPTFIFGLWSFPRLGVTGAAFATLASRSVGVFYQAYCMVRRPGPLRFATKCFRLDFRIMWRLVRVSSSAALQFGNATLGWVILLRLVAFFGTTAIAAYTVANRIMIFAILPSWGLSNAASALVGQSLGAGDVTRAETTVWRIARWNCLILGCIGVALYVFATRLAELFIGDAVTIRLISSGVRIFSCGNLMTAYGMVISQAFNGAGDTVTPLLINLSVLWLLELPLAWGLTTQSSFGVQGVFVAIVTGEGIIALISVWWFWRGTWKRSVV